MQKFVVHANIEHFRARLQAATDPHQRDSILKLLDEEIAKLPSDEQDAARRAASAGTTQQMGADRRAAH